MMGLFNIVITTCMQLKLNPQIGIVHCGQSTAWKWFDNGNTNERL
jgi:hypothetical protein